MSLHSLAHAGLPGCTAGSSCDGVLGSPWSMVLGFLPVSILAAGLYVSFLICLFLIDRAEESLRPWIWAVELVFCGAIAGSAVWFTLLQVFVLGSFCKYCIAAHSIGLILSVWMLSLSRKLCNARLSWRGLSGTDAPQRGSAGAGIRYRWPAFALGICLAAALAGFQALTVDENGYYEGSSETDLPVLSEKEFPVLGDGAKTVVLMYDYQCPHCKKVHEAVQEIVETHPGEFRFILCPTPLSNGCNPYIPAGKDYFPGSCAYARLALAVYALAPDRFWEMDAYLWGKPDDAGRASARPAGLSPADAEDFAASLVGRQALNAYLASDRPFVTLSHSFELFGRTNVGDKAGLPRFIIGQSWIIPEASDPSTLLPLLQ